MRVFVTKTIISRMLSLLDFCYKKGVEAARTAQDEGLSREFLERTQDAGEYGLLSEDPIYVDWEEWMIRLRNSARESAWSGVMAKFIRDDIRAFGANYLSAFIPVSFCFYRRGIKDFNDAPGGADYEVFMGRNRVWWTPSGLRNIKPEEYVDYIQILTFSLQRRDQAVFETEGMTVYKAKKRALTPKQYDSFRMAVGLASNKKC